MSSLLEFWRKLDMGAAPYAHPADLPTISAGKKKWVELGGWKEFVASDSFGRFDDPRLHLSLLPVPYGGDLSRAEIIILLLNPGLAIADYYSENRAPAYRRRLEANLNQDLGREDFPFLWLDPEFCWHSGFRWWEGKLRELAWVIARNKFKGRYLDALRDLSRRIAHVQLIPYHSPSFQAHTLLRQLPSSLAAQEYVREDWVASHAGKTIIATRGIKYWQIGSGAPNLVAYPRSHTRGASLRPDSPGGRAILGHYGIDPY